MPATVSKIAPCLWFDHQAEEAAQFYIQTFPNARYIATSYYAESSDNPSGKPRGSVLTVEFEAAGQRFTALNGGPMFVPNPSISFFVHVDSVDEAERVYAALAEGGQALMPIGAYPWSERYGWVKDRFGVSWQVMAGHRLDSGATFAPCLMFSGPQFGRAEEAIQLYTRLFPQSQVTFVDHYTPEEAAAGKVKHGRFVLSGQDMVAMDSHIQHGFTFNEGISLQVSCADQAEVDHFWAALGDGGEPGPCGWLKDRFGVSWQIVPAAMEKWLSCTDSVARDRAFAAMMQMSKLDIAVLEAALAGQS